MQTPPDGPGPGHVPTRSIQELIKAVDNAQTTSRCIVAASTILVFDYFLTLLSEVKYLWPANRGLGNFLYVILRISGLIDVTLFCLVFLNTSNSISPQTCTVLTKVAICSNMLGLFVSECTLSMRVWATWNYNRWVGLILIIALVGGVVPAYTLLAPTVTTILCLHYLASLVVGEASMNIILAVSGIKGWETFKYRPSRFIRTLYRDSLLYYIGALGASVVNILTFTFKPAISLFLLQHVLHCVFIGRMILNLRKTAYKEKSLGEIRTDSWGAQLSLAHAQQNTPLI
ncbi:hypothetical protein M422DRAFT_777127 [Sphaerobolus stellatus SS14]|nr:hypothetical protein M422DRAFT_777127 [Sphaerobolus stellatus SS14]